jgi:hypothetical protein
MQWDQCLPESLLSPAQKTARHQRRTRSTTDVQWETGNCSISFEHCTALFIYHQMKAWLQNNELQTIQVGAAVTNMRYCSFIFLQGPEQNHKNHCKDSQPSDQDFNLEIPKYAARLLYVSTTKFFRELVCKSFLPSSFSYFLFFRR